MESPISIVGAACGENETSCQHPAARQLTEPFDSALRARGGKDLSAAMLVARSREERFAHREPRPLGEPLPGQRQSVKAASREAVARLRDSLDGLSLVRPPRAKRSCSVLEQS